MLMYDVEWRVWRLLPVSLLVYFLVVGLSVCLSVNGLQVCWEFSPFPFFFFLGLLLGVV